MSKYVALIEILIRLNLNESGNIYYDAAIYLNSYSIDDSGYVELAFLGEGIC